MKKILALVSFVMMGLAVNAQQDLLLSQQFFSRINKNPAGTGNVTDLDLFLLGKYSYIEIKDAPKSFVLNAQTFRDKLNSGIGLSLFYDNLGVARTTSNFKATYAYIVRLNDDLIFSMGLAAGIQYSYIDPWAYSWDDPREIGMDDVPSDVETTIKPDFDFGVELTSPRLLLGASITHITNNNATTLIAGRHVYGYARYMFPVSETFEIAPALSYMHRSKTDVVELNVTGFYDRFLWGGFTYHPDIHDKFKTNPVDFTVGIEYRNFRMGYTFGWAFGAVSKFSGNSQELMLSYSIAGKKKQQAAEYVKFE